MTGETDGQGQQQHTNQYSKWHTQHLSTEGEKNQSMSKIQSPASPFPFSINIIFIVCYFFPTALHYKGWQLCHLDSRQQRAIWSYSLLCDKHLNQKDAEEDEGGTANIMFEHRQIQVSVLRRGETEHTWTSYSALEWLNGHVWLCGIINAFYLFAALCPTNRFFQMFLWKEQSKTATLFRLRPLPEREEGKKNGLRKEGKRDEEE